ncbi:3-hydroxyisobutyrate dehydrogenase-like protein [Cucurbitaria berberidis CBS 394.84]|uniref:3-hydroxyisobutyrate dehydrogenase n=1 Tax=Cucurbitaria berberidis CBS 394.84 TaxID=1168544 RepID=A0A9P4GP84_9PLEO|nr:3-hydroxyisobutyrate dehydrogenase-like protein [Cucurbitaria berberidis CBS 394.84]KAF1848896.1 3-hydroxyisobutyrate dehydrogenase-like protein [Cucurbitaria berberidis CBS 394.84]
MATSNKTIAFIGLGVMGYPMALNLRKGLDESHTLLICDVSSDALVRFQKDAEGHGKVNVVENGYEAIQKANTVITMLPDAKVVNKVYLDSKTGILAGAEHKFAESSGAEKQGNIIMECGTIETATILEVAKAVESSNVSQFVTFVDAPVSGGPMGAQDGTLAFMAGLSNKSIWPTVKGYLSYMGNASSIFLCGDIGSGTAFKVINNYLSAITSLAASEALNIGAKMGLNLELLTDVINVSGGQCWVTSKSNPVPGIQANVPSSRDYEGGFRIELCAKVLGMGSQLAEMVGAKTVLDKPTLEAFGEAMQDERYKGKDARVVYKWLNESGRE